MATTRLKPDAVLDLLGRLVEKSMVSLDARGEREHAPGAVGGPCLTARAARPSRPGPDVARVKWDTGRRMAFGEALEFALATVITPLENWSLGDERVQQVQGRHEE